MLKLNLGCGKRIIPGFIHIDWADFPHIDYIHDIRTLPMFDDQSVDLIYSSHTIEYFDRDEVIAILTEWQRVLKHGGRLRLAVPDIEGLVKVYNKHQKLEMILGPLYGKMSVKGREDFVYHRTIYDFNSLKDVLLRSGFESVRRYDWRQTMHKDFDDFSQAYIPHMDKDNGILISLNVEAVNF